MQKAEDPLGITLPTRGTACKRARCSQCDYVSCRVGQLAHMYVSTEYSYIANIILTYLLTHLLTYLLTYSLTCLLTYLLTYLLTHLLTYSLTYLLTYLLTYSTEQSPSREANRFAASQEIPRIL